MFVSLLLPYLPPSPDGLLTPPALMQTAVNRVKPDMVFDGGCDVVQTPDTPSEWPPEELGGFWPAETISWHYEKVLRTKLDISQAKVTVLQGSAHGRLIAEDAVRLGHGPESGPLYSYRPKSGYLGPDRATLLIEIAGKHYKVHFRFHVVKQANDYGYPDDRVADKCYESQSRRIASLTFDQARVGWAGFHQAQHGRYGGMLG